MSEVRRLLAEASARLSGEDGRADAEILLAHALGVSRAWLYAHADDVPDADRIAAFRSLVDARAVGEPVAYLTGWRAFWRFELEVTPDVLIPRPETELLVEAALERAPRDRPLRIADLGTGSGAIALALAMERPQATVFATDASAAALAVARRNVRRFALDNVHVAEGDWCAALGTEAVDLVVSNPPYIADGDVHLARGDLRREPRGALASGSDGLDAIRAIVASVPKHLVDGGWLLLEHGWEQAPHVRELLERGGFRQVGGSRDLAGHERISFGRLES